MTCPATLSVWGFISHNSWTFRAVEIGMLIDATLLALAYPPRVGQKEAHHGMLDALVAAADECLFLSKQQGRNRVTDHLPG